MNDLQKLLEIQLDKNTGFDVTALPIAGSRPPLDPHSYWEKRKNDRVYLMTVLFAHYFCRSKRTIADVGCHSSPLVLLVPGFKQRFAIDPNPRTAPLWQGVDGARFLNCALDELDIRALIGAEQFDLIVCHQVIEHLEEPVKFATLLLSKARRVILSTTFETPADHIPGHVQDPIDLHKFEGWFSRKPLGTFISRGPVGGKILAVF